MRPHRGREKRANQKRAVGPCNYIECRINCTHAPVISHPWIARGIYVCMYLFMRWAR